MSIFKYVTNTLMYENKSECFDDTPPFLAYISGGIQKQNIDIENELRGSNKVNSKCKIASVLSQQKDSKEICKSIKKFVERYF